jgi:hypothetical protein
VTVGRCNSRHRKGGGNTERAPGVELVNSFAGGQSVRGVKLTTHLHLVARLRLYLFMAWCLIKNGGNFTVYSNKSYLSNGYRGVKAAGREADHSTSSSSGVKNSRAYFYSPIRLHGAVINYSQRQLYLGQLLLLKTW